MIALVLERQGIPVENRIQLGPTKVVRTALLSGEIDIYPEYTGNGAFFHGMENDPAWKAARLRLRDGQAPRRARSTSSSGSTGRRPTTPGSSPCAATSPGARSSRPWRISPSFRQRPGAIKLAGSAEFVESPAALPSFERVYDFKLPRDQIVVLPGGDTAVTMRAAAQSVSGVNAAMVYGTDGAIAALDLVVMEDTKGAQIVYEPAPVVRADVLQRYPAIAPALARVFGSLIDEQAAGPQRADRRRGQAGAGSRQRYLEQEGLLR